MFLQEKRQKINVGQSKGKEKGSRKSRVTFYRQGRVTKGRERIMSLEVALLPNFEGKITGNWSGSRMVAPALYNRLLPFGALLEAFDHGVNGLLIVIRNWMLTNHVWLLEKQPFACQNGTLQEPALCTFRHANFQNTLQNFSKFNSKLF